MSLVNNRSSASAVDTVNFENWLRFFYAFLMKFAGAYEAILVPQPPVGETAAQLKKRNDDHGDGNRTAVSHLMDACFRNVDAQLIAVTYKGSWAHELLEILKKRFARSDSKVVQNLVRSFHQMEMLGTELPGKFVDRVKGVCAQIFIQNPAERPTDLSTVTVLREGIKKRLPILYSVLSVTPDLPLEKLYEEIVKCDESSLRDASSPVSASYVQAGTEELYAQFLAERKPGHVAKAKSVHWKVKGGEKKAKSRANQPFHCWNCGDEDHSARQCTQPISEKCASQLKELR